MPNWIPDVQRTARAEEGAGGQPCAKATGAESRREREKNDRASLFMGTIDSFRSSDRTQCNRRATREPGEWDVADGPRTTETTALVVTFSPAASDGHTARPADVKCRSRPGVIARTGIRAAGGVKKRLRLGFSRRQGPLTSASNGRHVHLRADPRPPRPTLCQPISDALTALGVNLQRLVTRDERPGEIIARADAEGGVPIIAMWDERKNTERFVADLPTCDTLPAAPTSSSPLTTWSPPLSPRSSTRASPTTARARAGRQPPRPRVGHHARADADAPLRTCASYPAHPADAAASRRPRHRHARRRAQHQKYRAPRDAARDVQDRHPPHSGS